VFLVPVQGRCLNPVLVKHLDLRCSAETIAGIRFKAKIVRGGPYPDVNTTWWLDELEGSQHAQPSIPVSVAFDWVISGCTRINIQISPIRILGE
jgi:hypothetical protein